MFHIELRQFPHNLCRFNLDMNELRAQVLDAWARGEWFELDDRKWNPHQARLTVMEAPRIPVSQLSMGRGWRTVRRTGSEVTERVLADVAETSIREHQPGIGSQAGASAAAAGPATHATAAPGPAEQRLLADSLGLELLSHLAGATLPLSRAWELAGERHPESTPAQSLALAEAAVRSLLDARLIELVKPDRDGRHTELAAGELPSGQGSASLSDAVPPGQETVLRALSSWSSTGADTPGMRRA